MFKPRLMHFLQIGQDEDDSIGRITSMLNHLIFLVCANAFETVDQLFSFQLINWIDGLGSFKNQLSLRFEARPL